MQTIRRLLADTAVSVWFLLISATVATAVLGLEQSEGGAATAGIILVGIACVKMRLVGIHFMELGNAPPPLRMIFEGYVAVTFTVLMALLVLV